MARESIYLPPEIADAEVIRVDGVCYERVRESPIPPDTFGFEKEFETCDECEGSSSSSSGSSSEPSSSSDCHCTEGPQLGDGPGGAEGTEWIDFPEPFCVDAPDSYRLVFFEPGLESDIILRGEFAGADMVVTYSEGHDVVTGPGWFEVNYGSSEDPRELTLMIEFMGIPDPEPPDECPTALFRGGVESGPGQRILFYPPKAEPGPPP